MTLHRTPRVARRVPRADRHRDVGRLQALRLHLPADADERRAEVAVDVVRERLQRRDIEDATPFGLGRGGLDGEAVEAPEERRQRLAAAGRGRHQDVAAGRDLAPAPLLDRGGGCERGPEPRPRGPGKEIE